LCARLDAVVTGPCKSIYTDELGHAGLLDNRVVTTHRQNAPPLAALFPRARVEFDRIYVRDERPVTSADVNGRNRPGPRPGR
jgi:transcriptional regulator GlxA family with amidase domain